jgi:hypothetical protein
MTHIPTHEGHMNFKHALPLLGLVLLACASAPNVRPGPERPSYELAPKTSRAHVLAESVIILNSYNFTVESADSRRDYEALRTNWRRSYETYQSEQGEVKMEVRDRGVLHLSPRGAQSDRSTTLVASRLEFELQKRDEKKDQWNTITPSPDYEEQYAAITQDIQRRLRGLGYIF